MRKRTIASSSLNRFFPPDSHVMARGTRWRVSSRQCVTALRSQSSGAMAYVLARKDDTPLRIFSLRRVSCEQY